MIAVGRVWSTREPACLLPSRYIEYMCDMVAEEPVTPHSKPILVKAVVMTPVPLFSKQRNGCRPFCEVYVGDERVTTTSQEYDKMRWALAQALLSTQLHAPGAVGGASALGMWPGGGPRGAGLGEVGLGGVGWRQGWRGPWSLSRSLCLSGSLEVIS